MLREIIISDVVTMIRDLFADEYIKRRFNYACQYHGWFVDVDSELTYHAENTTIQLDALRAPHDDGLCDDAILEAYARQHTHRALPSIKIPSYFWHDYFLEHKTFNISSRLIGNCDKPLFILYTMSISMIIFIFVVFITMMILLLRR